MPPLVRRIIDDLETKPAYVMNLRWDVIGWNAAAEALFRFSQQGPGERNMLWMLFSDEQLSSRIAEWDRQAPQILASFRRDFAKAPNDEEMMGLVKTLELAAPAFRLLWNRHDVHGHCEGRRSFLIEGQGHVVFDHSTFIVDEERNLRLVVYAIATDVGP